MQAGGSIIKRLFCIFCVGLVLLISSGRSEERRVGKEC